MKGLYRYLDASTGHITQQDNQLMVDLTELPFRYAPNEYGYIVWISDELTREELEDSPISDDFTQLILYAKAVGCGILNLDMDGEQYKTLHLNNW